MSITENPTARIRGPIGDGEHPIPDPPACFGDVELASFTADPPSVSPFGDPVQLRWNVNVPAGCPTAVLLNNAPVGRSGSMTVEPAQTTTYTLVARALGFTRTLGRVTVPVDTSACITGSLQEAQVRDALRKAIAEVDAATRRIKLRREPTVEIDAKGIKVAIRMEVVIDNFVNPDLDVDFVLGVRTRDGEVEMFYRSFSVDLDWPWWVTTVSLGISKIVEEIIENEIEGRLKREILSAAKGAVDGFVDQLPGNLKVHRVTTAPDRIDVTVCPAGRTVPHVVLGGGVVVEAGGVFTPT